MNLSMPVVAKKTRSWRLFIIIACVALTLAAIGYWFTQGFVTLDDARLLHSDALLSAQSSGKVATVEVKAGQRVKKGDVLFTFDPQAQHDELAKASAELAAIAATLPPEALQQLAKPQNFPSQQTLEEAIEHRRIEENEARRQVEAASSAQGKATYEANRAQAQLAKGRATQDQLNAARDARQKTDAALATAKAAFEKISLARAATEEKLQQLRVAALQTGTANMPVYMRIKAYEGQLATVQAAQARFTNATVRCPQDGIVSELFISPGISLTAGQPYMKLGIVGDASPLVVGYTTGSKSARIKKGLSCKVAIAGVGDFTGKVESTALVSAPPFPLRATRTTGNSTAPQGYFVVQVRLDAGTSYELAALPELSLATVSILLRD